MRKIDLSIIIVNYQTLDLTIDCLKSILCRLERNFEVIVINNHPQSGDGRELKKIYGGNNSIKILESKNFGFGAANNLGVKSTQGEFMLFLNSDTKIIDQSIQKMIRFMQTHPEIGALNPLLYHPDGKRQKHYFGDFQSLISIITRRPKKEKVETGRDYFYRQRVTGAAMMVRKKDFLSVGGFDQKFFMYFEDEDLCRRLYNLGKKNAILTTAKIIHLEGKSLNPASRKKMYYQSQNYYWQKHYGYFMMFLMRFLRFPYILWQKTKK